jgi:hypothetical protein
MAKGTEVDIPTAATVEGLPDEGFEWQTVHVEAARTIALDEVGDLYIGELATMEWIDPMDENRPDERFLQIKFKDQQGITAINCGYELRTYFDANGVVGYIYRIELKRKVEVGRPSPMLSYRIDVAKPAVDANSAA